MCSDVQCSECSLLWSVIAGSAENQSGKFTISFNFKVYLQRGSGIQTNNVITVTAAKSVHISALDSSQISEPNICLKEKEQ